MLLLLFSCQASFSPHKRPAYLGQSRPVSAKIWRISSLNIWNMQQEEAEKGRARFRVPTAWDTFLRADHRIIHDWH
jgi:hypothetical protein